MDGYIEMGMDRDGDGWRMNRDGDGYRDTEQ